MSRVYQIQSRPGKAGDYQIDYSQELNAQQWAAVSAPPGPVLVIAGAGSGKTRTLTYRVAYLLENGVDPRQILLLTFTNKAAREMLARVESLLPQAMGEMWGGTFHSFGNRLLRRHAEELGFRPNFSILDEEDQKDLISRVIAEAGIDSKDRGFPKPGVLRSMLSLHQNLGGTLAELVEERFGYFDHLLEDFERIASGYAEKKRENNAMDFDDLLVQSAKLLADSPSLTERYQRQFDFILVDEYQDTNCIQADLVDRLAARSRNLMVVGDDAQSIYSWRGANFENILRFPERYPDAQVFKIETNYRSVPEVLQVANAAIEANERQFTKVLQAHRPSLGQKPALVALQNGREEAQFVAQRVGELVEEGINLDKIAVLYRAHFHSMELQLELTRRGVPYTITSGLRFFEQAHIKDVAAYLRFIYNRRDEVAFKRIAGLCPGIGKKGVEKLWEAWRVAPGYALESLEKVTPYLLSAKVGARGKAAWEQLLYTLDELLEIEAPSALLERVMDAIYDDYLKVKFPNYESRLADIDQLIAFAEQFATLDDFLTQLSLLSGVDTGSRLEEERGPCLTLSSVHQAKGLEWPAVFVIGLSDGLFPSARSLEDNEMLEEERRLFYVALTRAEDALYLCYPLVRSFGSYEESFLEPSRFFEEFSEDLVEEWRIQSAF